MVKSLWKSVAHERTEPLLNDSTTPLLGIYPMQMKKYMITETCTKYLYTVLLLMFKREKARNPINTRMDELSGMCPFNGAVLKLTEE